MKYLGEPALMCVKVDLTSVLHGSPGVSSTGPSLKGGRAPGFVGLGGLVLRLSTGTRSTENMKKNIYKIPILHKYL